MKRMKWWQRIGLVALVGLAAVALYAFWPIHEDLSALATAGSGYDARILRDSWGVPHIFGQTDADVAYGLAYAHAEDDFLTIQQALAAARGHLARLYGLDAAPNDYMVQLLRIWDVVDAGYETAVSPEMRQLLDAYAAGLNRYAALHSAEVLPGLFPVTGKDIAAGFVHRTPLFYGIDRTLMELFAEERQRPVSRKEGGEGRGEADNSLVSSLPSPLWQYGSNTFALAPGKTADGGTYFAVNAHQPWEGPATWYEAHLHSEAGWDMVGGLFPGAPLVIHGHNRQLGWAFTVNSPDLVDVYVLDVNPDNPNQYRFDGEWRDFEVRQAPITVKLLGRLRWTVRREVLWSVYGPAVRRPHGVYAVRFAGFGELGLPDQFYRLNKATDFAAWQAAMREGPLPMFNVGYADREGTIYYLYNGRIPVRAEGYDWEQYLPGDTSETLWTTYLPFDALPQVLNPPAGFIQNSNSSPFRTTVGPGNPDPAAYSATLGIETYMTNRALRALELFAGDDAVTWEEFVTYKYDMRYSADSDIPGFVARIVAAPTADEHERAAVAVLREWDWQATPDSAGATLMVLTLHYVNESAEASLNPSRLVGGDVPEAVLLDSFRRAVVLLVEQFGRVDVPWQEVNRLRRGAVDLGLGGGPDLLHAVYGSLEEDGRFRGFVGDSYVLLVSWDRDGTVHSYSVHQYGSATLRPDSPHYADQSPLFARRKLKPVWLDEADIRAHLQRDYRPGEEIGR